MAIDGGGLEEASLEQADVCGAGEYGEEGEGVDGVGASLVRDGLQVWGDLAVIEARLVWVGGIIVAPPARGNEGLEHVEALQEGWCGAVRCGAGARGVCHKVAVRRVFPCAWVVEGHKPVGIVRGGGGGC
jgi:hypothetical protein